jgi:hypothetical protein
MSCGSWRRLATPKSDEGGGFYTFSTGLSHHFDLSYPETQIDWRYLLQRAQNQLLAKAAGRIGLSENSRLMG